MKNIYSDTVRRKVSALPKKPGVYQFKDKQNQILYIGKAANLKNRVRQYFGKNPSMPERIKIMVAKVEDIEIIITDSEVEALILEANLIKKIKPRYNVSLKDDKSYPYIVVTNEPYPRIFVTHRIVRDGSRYFGPYTDVKSMRVSLKMIRDIFMVRSCNYFIDDEVIEKKKIRVCLDYHIKKCGGPCEGIVRRDEYASMVEEVVQVIKGKVKSLIADLREKMEIASADTRFEDAAQIRDKIRMLSIYTDRQKVIDTESGDRDFIAVARQDDDACGVIFLLRDGMIVGRRHLYLSVVRGQSQSEIMERLVENYYLNTDDIPRDVLLSSHIGNADLIAAMLKEKSNHVVTICIPKIGDKAKLMELCKKNAELLLTELLIQKEQRTKILPNSLIELQAQLRLPRTPHRIECFDISTLQGTDTVASMVVFVDGKPKKSEYRKFKIESAGGIDDFASMREVIMRRYSRLIEESGILPDLIVVDGGKGQLSSALSILNSLSSKISGDGPARIPIIGLAKRLEEIYTPGNSEPFTIPRSSPGLRLIQRIRNEAHRFAISYHRVLRKKRILQTELDLIKGIGKKRAKELLDAFGSVQGVKFATAEQLTAVVGDSVAAAIKEYYISSDEQTETRQS